MINRCKYVITFHFMMERPRMIGIFFYYSEYYVINTNCCNNRDDGKM